jgi:AmmeMemoRadiSam system protein B/AmmeMemoRadiSam system protein A
MNSTDRFFRLINLSGLIIMLIIIPESSCKPQSKKTEAMDQTNQELVTREAVVAGQFYPGNPNQLSSELKELYSGTAAKIKESSTLAVISPHAGYVFSGKVAAEAFAQVDAEKDYKNIFVIGPSHRIAFDGASIYTRGNFSTPLGIIPVDLDLARKLVKSADCFTDRTDAQLYEHSLEVQLPFLQYRLKKPFRIIPIVVGTHNVSTCKKIAEALAPYFNDSNLFVISTDFSHYPSYEDAIKTDRNTYEAILTNNARQLVKTLQANEESGVPDLATSLCGWTSVLTLLYITERMPGIEYHLVDYKNSGDARYYGDKSRVVGYCAIAITQNGQNALSPEKKEDAYELSENDKRKLLEIARDAITTYVNYHRIPDIDTEKFSRELMAPTGAFVSLYKEGKLRGCIGRFEPDMPLYKVVQEVAISSATRDHRFEPVVPDEVKDLDIEISVLTPLRRIHSINEIVLGKHGIYIKKGMNAGTYLPQVATTTNWNLEEFLSHCARDKAGIGWDGWKDAELYTYEAIIIKEK